MSTRSADQQRKQRQKEFKERKENQDRLKAEAKKSKRNAFGGENEEEKANTTVE